MKCNLAFLFLLFFLFPSLQAQLSLNYNRLRPGDNLIKYQVEYKTPGKSGQVRPALGFTSDTEIDALSASAVPDVNSIRTKLDNYFKNTTVTVTSYTYRPLVVCSRPPIPAVSPPTTTMTISTA